MPPITRRNTVNNDSAIQGQGPRFVAKDVPLIHSQFTEKRWKGMDDKVRNDVLKVLMEVANDPEAKTTHKLAASNTLVKIDHLNLKHEMFYTPKGDVDLSHLDDEELESALHELEQRIRQDEIITTLSEGTGYECETIEVATASGEGTAEVITSKPISTR